MRRLFAVGLSCLWLASCGLALFGLALSGLASSACGQVSIQLQSTECLDRELPFQREFTLEVVAKNANGSAFESLEFRISGFSIDALVLVTEIIPNPLASSVEGNPFESGAIITFPACQDGDEPLLLYTATMVVLLPNYTPQIEVQGIDVPTNPNLSCATATSCDAGVACFPSWVAIRQILVPPSGPEPPDGATGVSPNVQLSVNLGETCHCLGLPCIGLFFGVEADPPAFGGGCDVPLPQPGPLEPFTTYYWRVEMDICGEYASSPVWRFTTGGPDAVRALHWGRVKELFR